MAKRRLWSPEEKETVKKHYAEKGDVELGKILNRTPGSVRDIAKRLGVTRKGTVDDAVAQRIENIDRFPDYPWPQDIEWRDGLELWENLLEEHKKFDPYVETFTIDMSDIAEPIAIAFAADLHLGGGFTNHAEIKKTLEFIFKAEGMYFAIVGDSIEGFIPGVKPSETVEQQVGSVKHQLAVAKSIIKEAMDIEKLLFMTWGDHDGKWFEQVVGFNVMKHQVHRMVPYFIGRGIIRLKLGGQEYWIQANHAEYFSSQWNPNHPNRRQYERFFPADINVSGHKHKPAFQMLHHYDMLRDVGFNIGGKSWLVQAGTFKTGPDPYTIRGWSRGVIGVPTAVIYPDTHDIDIFDSPWKAAKYMKAIS